MPSRSVPVVANGRIASFLRLINIPLCVYVCVCVCCNFLRTLNTVFHLQYHQQSTIPPTVYKGSLFFTFMLAFVVSYLFDDGHSNRCEVVSHCGFNLRFPND